MDAALVTMQETACQFGDGNILTNAAKLGFAISTLAIPVKHEAESLIYRCINHFAGSMEFTEPKVLIFKIHWLPIWACENRAGSLVG